MVDANEIRRNQYVDVPSTSNSNFKLHERKGILRAEIPLNSTTMGLPLFREERGNGVFVVAASSLKKGKVKSFQYRWYTTGVIPKEREGTQSGSDDKLYLPKEGTIDNNKKRNKLYKQLLNAELLEKSYELVSKSKGANTPGIDDVTLDGYSKDTIKEVIQKLKDHTYQFKPIRRVYIPKKDGTERPIGIPGPRDKVVQKAVCLILEEIYENIFLDCSHGFRRNKGTHTALKQVTSWTGTRWFIEGDISKYFDTINHHILAQLLQTQIDDRELIDFYWKAVKAHYVNPLTKEEVYSEIGSPQGGTLSPLLSNIYLQEFDKFMQHKVEESKQSGPTSKDNPEYKKIHTKISNLRQRDSLSYRWGKTFRTPEEEKERMKTILSLEKERSKMVSKIPTKGYRIYYVRYADDFLIGINGTRTQAVKLRKEIQKFLQEKLELQLNMDKTKITSAINGRAKFLGAELKAHISKTADQMRRKNSQTKTGRSIRARMPQGRIIALAPIETITKKLAEQGICQIKNFAKRDVIPQRKTAWINLPLHMIIQKYNWIWDGILNYYSFAYNRSQLNFIQYLLLHSAACTIMNKMKLNSRRQVFRKYGGSLTIKLSQKDYPELSKGKEVKFKIRKSLKRQNKFSVHKALPYQTFLYSIRTIDRFDAPCAICGSKENVEMHHRRPLKGTDNTLKGIKKNLSRKQIPLCRVCHIKVHRGEYDGPGIY